MQIGYDGSAMYVTFKSTLGLNELMNKYIRCIKKQMCDVKNEFKSSQPQYLVVELLYRQSKNNIHFLFIDKHKRDTSDFDQNIAARHIDCRSC